MSRDGKYFLVKTTKDNSEHQLKMLRREDFGLTDKDAYYVWKTLGCTQKYASPELSDTDVRDCA